MTSIAEAGLCLRHWRHAIARRFSGFTVRGIAFRSILPQGIRVSIWDGDLDRNLESDLDGDRHHRSGSMGMNKRRRSPLPITT